MMNRRTFLSAAGAFFLTSQTRGATNDAPRFAVIDWAMLETCLAIGAIPQAATELVQYHKLGLEPRVPDSVTDIGLRGAPNLELLHLMKPDLIVSSNFYEYRRSSFERIAPVVAPEVYVRGKQPYSLLEQATLQLGERLNRQAQARALIGSVRASIIEKKQQLSQIKTRTVYLINFGDARHFRAFGRDSLFGDVLERLGFENAWNSVTNYSATAPVGLEQLANKPDAAIVVIGPTETETLNRLPQNALWNALPAIGGGRVSFLSPLDHFGGLPVAQQFADQLTKHWLGQKRV